MNNHLFRRQLFKTLIIILKCYTSSNEQPCRLFNTRSLCREQRSGPTIRLDAFCCFPENSIKPWHDRYRRFGRYRRYIERHTFRVSKQSPISLIAGFNWISGKAVKRVIWTIHKNSAFYGNQWEQLTLKTQIGLGPGPKVRWKVKHKLNISLVPIWLSARTEIYVAW